MAPRSQSSQPERLLLRGVRASDAANVLVFRGDPIVQRFDGFAIHAVAEAAAFNLDELHAAYQAGDGITWGVTLDAALAGMRRHFDRAVAPKVDSDQPRLRAMARGTSRP